MSDDPDSIKAGKSLETRAHKATIFGLELNKKMLQLTALGVAVAVAAILVAVALSGQSQPLVGGDQIEGSPCAKAGPNCTVTQLQNELQQLERSVGERDRELVSELRRTAKGTPTGTGPWPFVVVNTVAPPLEGLRARTSPDEVATKIGGVHNRDIVWAECVKESAFTPPVPEEDNVGPLWLNVRWSNTRPDDKGYYSSEPTSQHRAWMYRGYTVPFNHNGKIPSC